VLVEISATGWSLIQRSPTECKCVSLDVIRCNNKHLHLQRIYKEVRLRKTGSFVIYKLESILSQFKPIYINKIYFREFVFNIILQSTYMPAKHLISV